MQNFEQKVIDFDRLASLGQQLRAQGRKVVTTNGCFDLLHIGHATYLQQAKALGDILVVAVNSDRSVKQLKGPARPLVSERDRALLIAALGCVDYVVIFDDSTPVSFLEQIRPAVHVKGGDYDPKKMVESETVVRYGGQVICLPFVAGYSTSSLINKIENSTQAVGKPR